MLKKIYNFFLVKINYIRKCVKFEIIQIHFNHFLRAINFLIISNNGLK